MIRAVLIAGPTASGKSQAALAVAERYGGVVVNADSMQVYRELSVLSARPGPDDEARAPHRLYGCVPAARAYSAGRWLGDVADVLQEIWRDGGLPVIVGGTGLYFQALLQGLADVPETPGDVRRSLRAELGREGAEALHRRLAGCDPELAARLAPGDAQRIVRGLEVFAATGRSLSAWQQDAGQSALLSEHEAAAFVLWPPREDLYGRCERRFDAMIEAGALDEVRRLMALQLDPGLPAMKALGVRQLAAHIRGEVDLASAISDAKTWTRRYAKRQLTWLWRNMISWNAVSKKDSEQIIAEIFAILRENELTVLR
jgi:tRNA dimethylallyltransferase